MQFLREKQILIRKKITLNKNSEFTIIKRREGYECEVRYANVSDNVILGWNENTT